MKLGDGRYVYVHDKTKNRIVREDGTVWCTDHSEELRTYRNGRGIQRKCRSCGNEYMRDRKRGRMS